MYRTGVIRSLTARHSLRGDFGPESTPHSHPYRIEWIAETIELDKNGFSTDIAVMESTLEVSLGAIDDVYLNDLPFFESMQPSLENLARFIAEDIARRVEPTGATAPVSEIVIWESDTAWASYRPEQAKNR